MHGSELPGILFGLNSFKSDAHGHRSHEVHGLANGRERRSGDPGMRYIVKADYGTLFRNADARGGQGPNRAQSGHIVEGHQRSESLAMVDEPLGQRESRLESRIGML